MAFFFPFLYFSKLYYGTSVSQESKINSTDIRHFLKYRRQAPYILLLKFSPFGEPAHSIEHAGSLTVPFPSLPP